MILKKKVIESLKFKTWAKRLDSKNADEDTDDNFVFIAGYTSGGAPYGILNEEIFCAENGNKLNDMN